jgi:steroid delta-isomerase-like uncharacterized protein
MTTRSFGAAGFLTLSVVSCAVYSKKQPVESDKAVAAAYVKAWNQRDSVAIDTLLASDGVHEDVPRNFRGTGSRAVVQFLRGTVAEQPDFKWNVTNTLEDGQKVVLEWTWTGTFTGRDPSGRQVTGRRISGKGTSIAELDNGKIKRFTDYYDAASFFR